MKTIRIAFAPEDWRRIHEGIGCVAGALEARAALAGEVIPREERRQLSAIQDRIAEALEEKDKP